MPNKLQDPSHQSVRAFLRIAGPVALLLSVMCIGLGFVSFFASFNSMQPPRFYWLAIVGMPLFAIEAAMTSWAFLGAVARYHASEVALVGKDVINYMADGTQEGVRTMARAVGSGLSAGIAEGSKANRGFCTTCGHAYDGDDKFCGGCGKKLVGD